MRSTLQGLETRVEFLEHLLQGRLALAGRSRSDIEARLAELRFEADAAALDRLLSMPLSSMTREQVARLQGQARDTRNNLATHLATQPEAVWLAELSDFVQTWRDSAK